MKLFSVARWVGVMVINLFGFLTAPIIYPLVYPMRRTAIRDLRPFWFYFDDEDGDYGGKWFHQGKKNFWTAYKWSGIRNPAWNLQASLKPKQGLKKRVSSKGLHHKDGNYDISIYDMCVLKYINQSGDKPENKGSYLYPPACILGKMKVWYKIDKTLYFRYSSAGKKWGLWYEFQIGTDKRYLFRFKLIKAKVWMQDG